MTGHATNGFKRGSQASAREVGEKTVKPDEAQAKAKKLLVESRTASRLVEFLLETRHYESWKSRADFESRWNIGVTNIGTELRPVGTGRGTQELSFLSGDFRGTHFAIASKTETVPWPVEDDDEAFLATVWLVLNGQQVLVARYTAGSESYSASNFTLFSVEEMHWSETISMFFENTSRAMVDLKQRQEIARLADREERYAGKFTFDGRAAVAPSQSKHDDWTGLTELQRVNDGTVRGQQAGVRAGFGTAFVLYLSACLAVGVPLGAVGEPRYDPDWYIWFVLFELFVAWWALPLAISLLVGDQLVQLDELIDRSTIGGWANRAVRYGLPRDEGFRPSDNLWALQFFGSALLFCLVGRVLTGLPPNLRVTFVVVPILFVTSVVSVVGFAAFFVPVEAERPEMEVRIARKSRDRVAHGRRQWAQFAEWRRQPRAVWVQRARAHWRVTVAALFVVGIVMVLGQNPEIMWIGALLLVVVAVLWFAAAAWPFLLGLAALVFLLKNC